MHGVLVVYKQVSMQFDKEGRIIILDDESMVHTISCDEKNEILAITATSDDWRPKSKNSCKRGIWGRVSLLGTMW